MASGVHGGCQVIGYTRYTQSAEYIHEYLGRVLSRFATNFIANSFYTLFPMKRSLHQGVLVLYVGRGRKPTLEMTIIFILQLLIPKLTLIKCKPICQT